MLMNSKHMMKSSRREAGLSTTKWTQESALVLLTIDTTFPLLHLSSFPGMLFEGEVKGTKTCLLYKHFQFVCQEGYNKGQGISTAFPG